MMSDNPYHNQHIQEYASAMEETVNEITQHYDGALMVLAEQFEELSARVEALEQMQDKPVEVEANVRLNEKSVKDLRAKLARFFKF
jgi:DNA anti-recombination protein RmuC